MARTVYHEFLSAAQEAYDFPYRLAVELYREYRDLGFSPQEAYDVLFEEVEEEEPAEEYEPGDFYHDTDDYLDYDWEDVDDLWLDVGDEIELTVDVAYEEGE